MGVAYSCCYKLLILSVSILLQANILLVDDFLQMFLGKQDSDGDIKDSIFKLSCMHVGGCSHRRKHVGQQYKQNVTSLYYSEPNGCK